MIDLISTILGRPAAAEGGWVNKPPTDDYWYAPRAGETDSGIQIDEDAALRYTTVFQCVQKIAKTVATLPYPVYQRLPGGGKRKAADHQYYALIHDAPNTEMDAVAFWESMVANLLLWGTGYAEIVRDRTAGISALWPLMSRSITPRRDAAGRMYYEHRPTGGPRRDIPAWRMLRISGLSLDGLIGLSVIGYWREAISLGLAASKFGARFYLNGAAPSGVLEVPKGLSDRAYKRMVESWNKDYSGLNNVGKTPLLEEDTKYHSIGIPLKDAQFIELRKFQRAELCGLFDVPPHKIGDLERATFSNIEDQNIQWVTDCIGPWCVRIAAAVNHQIFSVGGEYFSEHKLDAILRGDMLSRYQAHAVGRQWGWRSVNEIKEIENENPIGPAGDVYLTPLNMADSAADDGTTADQSAAAAAGPVEQLRPLVIDACRRIVARETKAVGNACAKHSRDKDRKNLLAWLDKFYGESAAVAAEIVQPVIESLFAAAKSVRGNQAAAEAAKSFADQYATISLAALRDCLAQGGDPARELALWQRDKPQSLAAVVFNIVK